MVLVAVMIGMFLGLRRTRAEQRRIRALASVFEKFASRFPMLGQPGPNDETPLVASYQRFTAVTRQVLGIVRLGLTGALAADDRGLLGTTAGLASLELVAFECLCEDLRRFAAANRFTAEANLALMAKRIVEHEIMPMLSEVAA